MPHVPAGDHSPATPLDTKALERAVAGLGIPAAAAKGSGASALTPAMLAAFECYAAHLVRWNARLNLTRLSSPRDIAVRHIADSLAGLLALPEGRFEPHRRVACVDIGSGAGMPGIAMAVVRPDWSVTLLEATAKKATFLEHVVAAMGLNGVWVSCQRAEALGQVAEHRASYELAFARAVAELRVLLEYALPLLAVGGRLVALKGQDAADEADAAGTAASQLGGRVVEVRPYALPGTDAARHVVVVDKVDATPDAYPRRPGTPAKRPL